MHRSKLVYLMRQLIFNVIEILRNVNIGMQRFRHRRGFVNPTTGRIVREGSNLFKKLARSAGFNPTDVALVIRHFQNQLAEEHKFATELHTKTRPGR